MNKKQLRLTYSEKRKKLDGTLRKPLLEKIIQELPNFNLSQKHVSIYLTIADKNEILG